jgi:spectinomycin phosphotransferase
MRHSAAYPTAVQDERRLREDSAQDRFMSGKQRPDRSAPGVKCGGPRAPARAGLLLAHQKVYLIRGDAPIRYIPDFFFTTQPFTAAIIVAINAVDTREAMISPRLYRAIEGYNAPMLTPPALATETIIACLRDQYGLRIRHAAFLPIGADAAAAVYRVEDEDSVPYFLKLKRSGFDEIAVAVPAYLRAQGIAPVMAPLPTTTNTLWAQAHGFTWILYPFFEGANGFRSPLSDAQWVMLGRSLRAVHDTTLPPDMAARVPREDFSPRWRDAVLALDRQVAAGAYDALDTDRLARRLAAFWRTHRDEIRTLVERAGQLAATLKGRNALLDDFVLCHTDLHAGNVLLSASDELELAIVDWDAPIFAPKERDLMFIGAGIGAIWNEPREQALFYQGYGQVAVDTVALSYYRYERIVEDFAAYGEQLFEAQGSEEDREHGLEGVIGQFLPGRVIPIAHQTYEQLDSGAR